MAEAAGEASEPVLRFENVTVCFDDVHALQNVSFDAARSESRVILGAAGSGKTILLKTAMGLIKPTSGTVYAFGRDLTTLKERELFEIRSRIGMLFQESALFDSLTIEENVAYPLLNQQSLKTPKDQVHPKVAQALEFVELGGTLEKFPSELSGGMRRRAAIARAMVTDPPLILYDSPTAGLDPITAHTIVALLIKERDQSHTTTLVVTHRYQDGNLIANFRYNSERGELEPAGSGARRRYKTTFMVLRAGRLVFEGDQDQLEASADEYISKFVKPRE
jgi:phospholipid/cholesterol/gamma-HCH transport system ATP-binding protein